MLRFLNSLRDWKTDSFAQTLKSEIENLKTGVLPLEKGVSQGGIIDDSDIAVTVFGATDDEELIQAKVGIFFTEIVGCCGCGDEPMANNVYCEMQIKINKVTAETEIKVLPN